MNDVTPRARAPYGVLARLLALVSLLTGATALAQVPEGLRQIELERLTLNPAGTGSLLLGTGELMPRGGYRLSITGHYEKNPLELFINDQFVGTVVKRRVTGHLAGAYALKDWLELSVQVPLLLGQDGEDLLDRGVGKPAGGLALGTPYVGARVGLMSERDNDGVDVALGLNVGLPVGSIAALARDTKPRWVPSLMVGKSFGPLRASVDAGVTVRADTLLSSVDDNVRDEVGTEVRLGGTLATTGPGLRGELDLLTSLPFRREGASIEALAGVRLPLTPSLEGYALAGMGFEKAPGTPSFRALMGVAFGRPAEQCVAGGKHTPAQCPDLDDDGDGVRNGADACPTEGGKVDARGCPLKDDQDQDKDGIEDGADSCPTTPGVASARGCPDKDGDSVQDSEDKCPEKAGPPERQGCPVRDTDGDGLLDEKDACPTVAGIPELKGCPPKDTDGDTLSDHLDTCPKEPGPVENHGCPKEKEPLAVIKKGTIEIKQKVYFDTGKASIQSRSFTLLDEVAKIIQEHPELELVRIGGHTDSRGSAEFNRKLSQQRADSVRDYLITKGVAAERLAAQGFGPDRPIADNKTEKGRADNRRVEFITTLPEGEQK